MLACVSKVVEFIVSSYLCRIRASRVQHASPHARASAATVTEQLSAHETPADADEGWCALTLDGRRPRIHPPVA